MLHCFPQMIADKSSMAMQVLQCALAAEAFHWEALLAQQPPARHPGALPILCTHVAVQRPSAHTFCFVLIS